MEKKGWVDGKIFIFYFLFIKITFSGKIFFLGRYFYTVFIQILLFANKAELQGTVMSLSPYLKKVQNHKVFFFL